VKIGDYIRIAGKKPDWLDKQKGRTYPDYNALVVEIFPEESLFHCCIMKSDGRLWKIYETAILGAAK
jgi:hypothetical protein|tara:strand:- start:167 stop:367 length:201 start_codon:yes stop_codon:yes gene_type:complete